jgi:peptidyl-prolyl cis-trans isomerase C
MPATARHILVDTEDRCLQLKAEIEAGADFADVAQRESSCPSRQKGGDLGTFNPGQMVPEFDQVVFSGELNTVLGPVKTQFGYHLLEVTNRWEQPATQAGEETGLDQALVALRQEMSDATAQSKFYDLFLNTLFYVPTLDPKEFKEEVNIEEGQTLPLIIEADGNDYLVIFDSEERLKSWATGHTQWVKVPGYVLASTTMPPLHIAMNVGTEYSKQFPPDEITWLREVVERCNQANAEQEQAG